MSAIFDPIEIEWDGKPYRIEPQNILKAIARVEEHITLAQLVKQAESGSVSSSKLSMAFGTLIRFAGAKATDEEVFERVLGAGSLNADDMGKALGMMLSMMLPRSVKAMASSGNVQRRTTSDSSKKPTKRSSGKKRLALQSSGH